MWCDAIALSLHPGEAVDGLSAAFLWGVDLLPKSAPVSVSVPMRSSSSRNRNLMLAVTRTTLPPADVTTFSGIRLTTPLRTAFDLAGDCPE